MFVKQVPTPKGKIFIQIVQGYRGEYGQTSHKVIEKLGFLDQLDLEHNGKGLEWARSRAKELSKINRVSENNKVEITTNRIMDPNVSKKRSIGSLAINPVYEKLELKKACDAIQSKYPKFKSTINSILKFLIQSRLIDADSRLSSYNKIEEYIEGYTFSEDQMYIGMEAIGQSWEQLKDYATRKTIENYKLDTSISHYDGCNFYFEIDEEDDFRRKGMSKEGRKEPIVNFAMLSDKDLIPYDLVIYPGNESEHSYFAKTIVELKKKHNLKKVIYVADKGLNSGSNILTSIQTGNGYIYGQAIRSSNDKIFATNDFGFKSIIDDRGNVIRKIKSFKVLDAIIKITDENGKQIELKVPQKQVITWSKEYADKEKKERTRLINKAKAFIKSPKEYTKNKIGDASVYVKFTKSNKDGDKKENAKIEPEINWKKVEEDEKLDGYFMLVSSELDMPDEDIIKAYSAQKGQERNFRVNKTYLKIRPVYVSRETRIKAHVLVCYLTNLILKIIEKKVLNDTIPIEKIIEDLREYEAALVAPNTYFFFKYNETVNSLANLSNSNARMETQTISMIKKLFKY